MQGYRSRGMGADRVIGVDVGGTHIRAAVVERDGTIRRQVDLDTPTSSEAEILAAIGAAVREIATGSEQAVGFGVPCNLDKRTGRVLRATNLPLDDLDLAAWASSEFGLPSFVENDGTAAALAEWRLGAGRGARDLIMLTLGTGVGGGLVLEDQLYRGWAELGHVVVVAGGTPCQGSCHGLGHLEGLVSGTAADSAARRVFGPEADAETLVAAAREGHAEAAAEMRRIAEYLGAGIGSLANVFDPDVVVIGGGFGLAAADLLLPAAQEAARREAIQPADACLTLVTAELPEPGVVGAALVAYEGL